MRLAVEGCDHVENRKRCFWKRDTNICAMAGCFILKCSILWRKAQNKKQDEDNIMDIDGY
jgi:hypothetical protein